MEYFATTCDEFGFQSQENSCHAPWLPYTVLSIFVKGKRLDTFVYLASTLSRSNTLVEEAPLDSRRPMMHLLSMSQEFVHNNT